MKIALLQILPTGSLNGNREKGVEACRKAKVLGADIALFPEMWSNGYDIPEDAEALQRAAVPADGEFVSGFGELAAELNMAIAITFLEKTEKRPRNAVSLFDRHGRRLYTYAKVHTCDFWGRVPSGRGGGLFCCFAGYGRGSRAGRLHDLLRPGIPGKRTDSDAEGRGADPHAQRLPHGDQPPVPASGQGV